MVNTGVILAVALSLATVQARPLLTKDGERSGHRTADPDLAGTYTRI